MRPWTSPRGILASTTRGTAARAAPAIAIRSETGAAASASISPRWRVPAVLTSHIRIPAIRGYLKAACVVPRSALRARAGRLRASLRVGLFQCRMQSFREFLRVVIRPEVHEEEVRRVIDHVAVKRSHFDAVLAQRFEHRVDLACEQHEVAGDGGLATASGLEVHRD